MLLVGAFRRQKTASQNFRRQRTLSNPNGETLLGLKIEKEPQIVKKELATFQKPENDEKLHNWTNIIRIQIIHF